jgi:hypothetical protein
MAPDTDLVLDFTGDATQAAEVIRLVSPFNPGDGWSVIGRFPLTLAGVIRAFEMVARTDTFFHMVLVPGCMPRAYSPTNGLSIDLAAEALWNLYEERARRETYPEQAA